MVTIETWKRTQKKNEKRRATAKAHLRHRRLIGKQSIPDVIRKRMAGKVNLTPNTKPKKTNNLFETFMKIFQGKQK